MAISNVVALKKVVEEHDTAPVVDVVKAINIKLRLADQNENEARGHREEAGGMLVSLRVRVEADGAEWWKFAKDHFDRERRELEKLMNYVPASKIVKQAIAERPELDRKTDREVARELGVDHKTVGAARKAVGENSPTEKRVGKDGKEYAASKPPKRAAAEQPAQQPKPAASSTLVEQAFRLVARMSAEQRQVFMSKLKETYQW